MNQRPQSNEYIPYYSTYIQLVPEGDIIGILEEQVQDTVKLLKNISPSQAHFRYGPDKWTIKEVIGHIADTESIMSYRLLSFARGEMAELPGFDEDSYVQAADFNRLSAEDLLDNFEAVRKANVLLLKSLDEGMWTRGGSANESPVTVRALAWIIAGHELHHRSIIKDRYMGAESYPQA
ncbi:DinB family protein [Bacillus sp. FJAT-49736]|uniref:DinB family protein n=1 Tax=Bacillus sp. FJAT-49736 TaxID=2833582 RepID=UPI001BC936C6|nr:DinB family protein [Bacillus sp. FJAT-49736]MBS4174376.1 DinB family protein [Bacillus sp. FJAT-49736]